MRLRPSGDSTRASELSNAGSLSVTGWMADAFAGESPREHRHDLRAGQRDEHDVDSVQVELAAEQVAARVIRRARAVSLAGTPRRPGGSSLSLETASV
jgi:hypothetical protein